MSVRRPETPVRLLLALSGAALCFATALPAIAQTEGDNEVRGRQSARQHDEDATSGSTIIESDASGQPVVRDTPPPTPAAPRPVSAVTAEDVVVDSEASPSPSARVTKVRITTTLSRLGERRAETDSGPLGPLGPVPPNDLLIALRDREPVVETPEEEAAVASPSAGAASEPDPPGDLRTDTVAAVQPDGSSGPMGPQADVVLVAERRTTVLRQNDVPTGPAGPAGVAVSPDPDAVPVAPVPTLAPLPAPQSTAAPAPRPETGTAAGRLPNNGAEIERLAMIGTILVAAGLALVTAARAARRTPVH